MSSEPSDVITADDVAALNRAAVNRSAAIARIAGTALVIVGVVALAAAVWTSVRLQQRMDDGGSYASEFGDIETAGPSFLDRTDTFAQTFNWEFPVLALATGLALRLIADYAMARVGGSITGFVAGDRVPGDDTLDEPQVLIRPPDSPA